MGYPDISLLGIVHSLYIEALLVCLKANITTRPSGPVIGFIQEMPTPSIRVSTPVFNRRHSLIVWSTVFTVLGSFNTITDNLKLRYIRWCNGVMQINLNMIFEMNVVSEHKISDVTIARCVRLSRRLHCQQPAQQRLVQLWLQEWKPAQSKWSSLRVVHLEDQRFVFYNVVKCTSKVHIYKINEKSTFMNFVHRACKNAKLSSLDFYEILIRRGHFYWVSIATHALNGMKRRDLMDIKSISISS